MKRTIAFVLFMPAHLLLNGQTLEISSAVYNGRTQGIYLDSRQYSVEIQDTSSYVITYESTVIVDTLTREKFTSSHILLIGDKMNKFFPESKLKYDLTRMNGSLNFSAATNQHHVFFYEAIYTNKVTGNTYTAERLCEDDFIVSEETPLQAWTLHNRNMKIGEYDCYLAECDFRGRHFYAWYTEDIPLPYGPWKLGGLPGLIISAYDDDCQYEFTMREAGTESIPIFKFNYDYIETDRRKLNKLTNEILHKPVVYMANHYHLTSRRMRQDRLRNEREIEYKYDSIERDLR